MGKQKPRPMIQRDRREKHSYQWEAPKVRPPLVVHIRDDEYGYTVKHVNGIALSFVKDNG